MSENDNSASGLGWFLAGLGIGALAGVLYAPKSGRETRDELASSARDAREKANEYVDEGKEQLGEYYEKGRTQWSEYVDKGKDYLQDQQTRVNAAVDAGRQAFGKATEQTGEQIKEAGQHIQNG